MARGNLSGWPFQKQPKPVHSSLNVIANKNVLADANVSRLISLVQGYVSVQEDAAIISINLIFTVAHICHGKTYFSTVKLTFPWQNLLFHGKTYLSTAKITFPRQNLLFHGKTYFSMAKLTFPQQNLLFHGKTYFSTAKLHKGTWTGSVCKQNQDGDGL